MPTLLMFRENCQIAGGVGWRGGLGVRAGERGWCHRSTLQALCPVSAEGSRCPPPTGWPFEASFALFVPVSADGM